MSLYFYDTEFLEGTQTRRFMGIPFGKTLPTIDLISIGIVDETGREYYAVSKDFNLKEAWNRWQPDRDCSEYEKEYWLRENVLFPIWIDLFCKDRNIHPETILEYMTGTANDYPRFTYKNLKRLIKKYGKSNKEITEDILKIMSPENTKHTGTYPNTYPEDIQFYGWYSAYDHVALCWLFGKMIDLPNGFPMYTRDLKQMLDEKIEDMFLITLGSGETKDREATFDEKLKWMKSTPKYPKQTNEHNALSDAKWNKQLYQFLQKI